jgi:hypothetical protein
MVDLTIGSAARPAPTVFHLFGTSEDDLTRALAWTISQSDKFSKVLLERLDLPFALGDVEGLAVQRGVKSRGRTDIELRTNRSLIIFEAKLGWNLPSERQLNTYELRILDEINSGRIETGALVTLSECSKEWALAKLPAGELLPRRHLTWQVVVETAELAAARAGFHEKKLLRDLAAYLRSATSMHDDPSSQMTWVVPVTNDSADGSALNFIETVKAGYYYNKAEKVPKSPFNFIGFRWNSALREIRYVRSRQLFTDPRDVLPTIFEESGDWGECELFELGPAIVPTDPVPYGKLFQPGYHRALLDCLLTAKTVAEARDESRKRFEAAGLQL